MQRISDRQKPTALCADQPTPQAIIDCGSQTVVEQEALDHIRIDAYRKWEEAGCPASDGAEFWLEAEREYLDAHAMPDPSGTKDAVQEASEESFPASDPPARTISRAPAAHSSTVTASRAGSQRV